MTVEAVRHLPIGPEQLADPAEVHRAYDAWIYRTGLSDNTKRSYSGEVNGFLGWLGEQDKHLVADALTDPYARDYAVRDYRRYLLTERRRKPKGVDAAMTAVGSLYGWLGVGAAKIPTAARQKRKPKSLTPDEQRDAMRAAERRGPRDHAIVALAVNAGLRVSEIAALDTDDIWISARKGEVHVRAGKGDQPRTVPLNTSAREALERWLTVRNNGRDPRGPLFLSREGSSTRLAIRSIRHVVAQVGEAAGVPISPHMLRHTFGTVLVRGGTDIVIVADLMGHSRLDTARIYATPSEEDAAEAVERISIDY